MPLPKSATADVQPLVPARRRAVAHPGSPPATQLNMTMQHQQQTNWCWSAVSVSVKLFFTPAFAITQCEQANLQLAQTSCCINGGSSACNIPWFLDKALAGLGNFV